MLHVGSILLLRKVYNYTICTCRTSDLSVLDHPKSGHTELSIGGVELCYFGHLLAERLHLLGALGSELYLLLQVSLGGLQHAHLLGELHGVLVLPPHACYLFLRSYGSLQRLVALLLSNLLGKLLFSELLLTHPLNPKDASAGLDEVRIHLAMLAQALLEAKKDKVIPRNKKSLHQTHSA